MDGSMGARTAYMAEPFSDNAPEQAGWRGLLNAMADPPSEMTERCLFADQHGWQTAVHAIGDQAIHLLLNSYEQVQKTNGTRDRRQRVEHAQHIKPEDIPRFAKLGVIASMQPLHKADDGRYAEHVIGTRRLKGSYAFRSLLESGATVCFGSDWPVVSLNPFLGMAAAVTGRTNHGDVWLASENISIEDALRCYTIHAARACFMADRVGTIEKGKLADLVMLDRDVLTIPPEEIAKVKPLMTIMGGEIVYADAGIESKKPVVRRQ
jgi:predicted amidohydrolase YtcJ